MNYEGIYNKYYIRLPKIISIFWGALFAIIGLIEVLIGSDMLEERYDGIFTFLVGNEAYTSGIFALVVWAIIAFLIAYAIQFILKIAYSQKIMVVDRLTRILDNCRSNNYDGIQPQNAPQIAVASSADGLKKYKELLDSGVITQEEFDVRKKQLLGL